MATLSPSSILLSHPLSSQYRLLKPKFPPSIRSQRSCFHLKPFRARFENGPLKSRKLVSVANTEEPQVSEDSPAPAVGEDPAVFVLGEQKISSWIYFTAILGTVLYILDGFGNSTGFGKVLIDTLYTISDSPEVVMLLLTLIFAVVHSGLANLRDTGEKLIGERAFRVLFAGTSLPLALSTIVYFINHRYDGVQLWQLQNVTGLHEVIWFTNFISFFFLYPSTFNLLEVAAIDRTPSVWDKYFGALVTQSGSGIQLQ